MNEKDMSAEQTFSEKRYKTIFDIASVSLWEEDYSEIKKSINELKSKGITDFRKYFNETPDFVYKAAQMVKILNVNNFTLKFYGARSKDELLKSLDRVFTPESYKTFKELFIAIAEGKTHFESEAVNKTLQGEPIDILISVTIPSEDGEFKNLLVSIFDITRLKKNRRCIKGK
ncbi:MAG: PAS domain-containing protein [Nitrospinota bacterium]